MQEVGGVIGLENRTAKSGREIIAGYLEGWKLSAPWAGYSLKRPAPPRIGEERTMGKRRGVGGHVQIMIESGMLYHLIFNNKDQVQATVFY
jgi:hypothetical protein